MTRLGRLKLWTFTFLAVGALWSLTPQNADAQNHGGGNNGNSGRGNNGNGNSGRGNNNGNGNGNGNGNNGNGNSGGGNNNNPPGGSGGGGNVSAPELDPQSAHGAIALIVGGTLVLLDRRRLKRQTR